jgi:cobalt-zinc-cadmium efflux system outer membrane protein
MKWLWSRVCFGVLLSAAAAQSGLAQKALTWQEIRDRFEAGNPSLGAGRIGIEESRASETTAYLRPNPNLALLADQIDPFPGGPNHGTFAFLLPSATVTYMHEREHKRELRRESAQDATKIAI